MVFHLHRGIELVTIDTDEGLGLIRVRPNTRKLPDQPPWNDVWALDYSQHLEYNEAEMLQLVTAEVWHVCVCASTCVCLIGREGDTPV